MITPAGILTLTSIGAVVATSPAMSDNIWQVICQITGGDCSSSERPRSPPAAVPSRIADPSAGHDVHGYGMAAERFTLRGMSGRVQPPMVSTP